MVNPTPTLTNMASAQPGGSVASRHTAGAMMNMATPIPIQAENFIRLCSSGVLAAGSQLVACSSTGWRYSRCGEWAPVFATHLLRLRARNLSGGCFVGRPSVNQRITRAWLWPSISREMVVLPAKDNLAQGRVRRTARRNPRLRLSVRSAVSLGLALERPGRRLTKWNSPRRW